MAREVEDILGIAADKVKLTPDLPGHAPAEWLFGVHDGNRLLLGAGAGNSVVLETLRGEAGPRIVFSDSSVLISCGPTNTVEITDAGVKINGDALVVN